MSTDPVGLSSPPSAAAPRNIPPRNVVLSALTSYGGQMVDIITFLLLWPFIIDHIGQKSFGLWSLVWAVVTVLGLVDMGFGQSVVKFVADARGRDDADRLRRVVCTLFWVYVAETVIVWLMLLSTYGLFEDLFDVEGRVAEARLALLIVGSAFASSMLFGMFRELMTAHQKQWVPNLYKILATLIHATLVFVLLGGYPYLKTLAFLNLIVTLAPPVAVAIHAKATLPIVRLHPRWFDPRMLKYMWSHSLYFMIINVATLIYTRVDTFIIKHALDLEAVALYALAMRVSDQVQNFCFHISRVLTPVVAELHGAAEQERLVRVWLQGTKLAVAIASPLLIGCIALAEPLVVHWTSVDFLESVPVMQVLLAAAMVNVVHSNSRVVLSMSGHQRFVAVILFGAQVANALLSIAFVHPWGILGVATATLVSCIPLQVIQIQGRLDRVYHLPRHIFYLRTVVPSIIPTGIMLALFWLYRQIHPIASLWEVALLECAGCAVFFAAFWWLGFNRQERQWAAGTLRRLVLRRGPAPVV